MTETERQQMNALSLQIQQEKNYQRYEELIRQLQALIEEKENRFPEHQSSRAETASKVLPAVASRVIQPRYSNVVERVEIRIPTADDLYNEIRVENSFTDKKGRTLSVQPGTPLDLKIEAHTVRSVES